MASCVVAGAGAATSLIRMQVTCPGSLRRLLLGQSGIKPQISASALQNLLPVAEATAVVSESVAPVSAIATAASATAAAAAAVAVLRCGRCNGPTNRNKSHATWPICGVHKSVNNLAWPWKKTNSAESRTWRRSCIVEATSR